MAAGDARSIEDYLAALRGELRLPARQADRVVTEVGDHLHDAAAESATDGLDADEAAARAIERFGDPAELARGVEPRARLLFEEAVRTAVLALLGTAIAAGAGMSGLLAGLSEQPRQATQVLLSVGPLLYLPLGMFLRVTEQRRRLAARPVSPWVGAWNGIGWQAASRVLGAVSLLVFVLGSHVLFPASEDGRRALFLTALAGTVAALPITVAIHALRHRGRRVPLTPRRAHRMSLVALGITVASAGYAAVLLSQRESPVTPLLDAAAAAFLAILTVTGLDFLRRPHGEPHHGDGSTPPVRVAPIRRITVPAAAAVTVPAMAATAVGVALPTGMGVAMAVLDTYDEERDVTLSGCRVTARTTVTATVDITNTDGRAHTYIVMADVVDGSGERLSADPRYGVHGSVDVPARQSETVEITGVLPEPGLEGVDCELREVDTVSGL